MSVPESQAEELKQRLDHGENVFLLDVRDEYEYEISNIGVTSFRWHSCQSVSTN